MSLSTWTIPIACPVMKSSQDPKDEWHPLRGTVVDWPAMNHMQQWISTRIFKWCQGPGEVTYIIILLFCTGWEIYLQFPGSVHSGTRLVLLCESCVTQCGATVSPIISEGWNHAKKLVHVLLFKNALHQIAWYCGTMRSGTDKRTSLATCIWGFIGNILTPAADHIQCFLNAMWKVRTESGFSNVNEPSECSQ